MYICDACWQTFDSPVPEIEQMPPHFGHPCYETYLVSPCCHASYGTADDCAICGKATDITKIDNGVCVECAKAIHRKLDDFLGTLDQKEKEYLNAAYYGVDVF